MHGRAKDESRAPLYALLSRSQAGTEEVATQKHQSVRPEAARRRHCLAGLQSREARAQAGPPAASLHGGSEL